MYACIYIYIYIYMHHIYVEVGNFRIIILDKFKYLLLLRVILRQTTLFNPSLFHSLFHSGSFSLSLSLPHSLSLSLSLSHTHTHTHTRTFTFFDNSIFTYSILMFSFFFSSFPVLPSSFYLPSLHLRLFFYISLSSSLSLSPSLSLSLFLTHTPSRFLSIVLLISFFFSLVT